MVMHLLSNTAIIKKNENKVLKMTTTVFVRDEDVQKRGELLFILIVLVEHHRWGFDASNDMCITVTS